MTREQLIKILTHKNIVVTKPFEDAPANLDRVINFTIQNEDYKIEWYCNMMTLYRGNMFIKFTDFDQSGTYPNRAKLNLQFKCGSDIVAVIPIEYYEV